jgi:cellulose synthase/poly-beta-1,6-N-acetylglucosamine synthase-like glycosyltransferase
MQAGLNYAYFPTEEIYINGGYSIHHVNRPKETFFSSNATENIIPMRHIGFLNAIVKLNDKVIVNPLRIRQDYINELENNLVLYFTSSTRESATIIKEQQKNVVEKNIKSIEAMHHLKDQAKKMKEALLMGKIDTIGEILDYGFQQKKDMATNISNATIENIYQKVKEAFLNNPLVRVLTKENGGKATALQFGIEESTADYVVCIDADTKLATDAVSKLMRNFLNPLNKNSHKIGAVAGSVIVGNEVNILTKWQSIEYITSQNFDRKGFAYVNAITVIPGAIGAFKKAALIFIEKEEMFEEFRRRIRKTLKIKIL